MSCFYIGQSATFLKVKSFNFSLNVWQLYRNHFNKVGRLADKSLETSSF